LPCLHVPGRVACWALLSERRSREDAGSILDPDVYCCACQSGHPPFVVEVRGGECPSSARRNVMPQYLLSVHTVEGEPREPMTDEEMQQSWVQISALNDELKSAGAWVFAGALHGPDTATVVRVSDGEVLTTDGPFAEAKEHLGGFYAIEAEDLDAALAWASKATVAVGKPIEVRPFRTDG
jgi:hypothetical protein